jgi:hypothetical protein
MFRTSQNASKSSRFSSARKCLLGMGGIAVAGTLMAAAPAQARDRFEDHGRYERRDFHHDRVIVRSAPIVIDSAPVVVAAPPVVCAPVAPIPVQIWVPDQYEIRTHRVLGCRITERVLVVPGHWVYQ